MMTQLSTNSVSARRFLMLFGLLIGPMLAACAFAPSSWTGEPNPIAGWNAVYNCPTRTPTPTPRVPPTECVPAPTPENILTPPAPPSCTTPVPVPTAMASPTPYGRWASPGDRGTSNLFRRGQQIYIGPLRLTLQSYTRVPIPANHSEAHVWTLDVLNVSTDTPISITWPLQMIMRAVTADDGTARVGNWFITAASEQAIGVPAMIDLESAVYAPGDERTVRVAIEAPPGAAHAFGFLPDPTGEGAAANHPTTPTGGGETVRAEVGGAADVVWISPEEDPYCGSENTDGPPQQGDGGATYPRRAPTPAPALYGYFAGWPVPPSAQNTQGFGCTDFRELSGYDCPNDRPWFHSGIDLAGGRGTPLYAVFHGRVTYVGVSTGARPCTFPGAEEPRTNLGWMIQLQVLGSDGAAGPYTVKYGHTIVGSQRVQVGDEVWPGQILGLMGSTGCSTGPHLHFMVQNERGQFLDPMNFIGPNRRERVQP